MGAYWRDSRVSKVDVVEVGHRTAVEYRVDVDGDVHVVQSGRSLSEWWAGPAVGGRQHAAAVKAYRATDAEWMRSTREGPFGTSDEAIGSLIGDPR